MGFFQLQIVVVCCVLYVFFAYSLRLLRYVCELIIFTVEQLRASRARVEQLENIQLQHELTQHRVRLLARAEATLALAHRPHIDPTDMLATCRDARVLYTQFHRHTPLLRQPAIDAVIDLCASYKTIAEKRIERTRALALCMGTHPRLGARSLVTKLARELLEQIGLVSM